MFKKFFTLITSILVVLLLGSCATNSGKQEEAQQALQVFFERLAGGEYEAAVAQYGGSYETLVSFNPALNPDDKAALWQSGCQVNGLQCLTVRTAIFKELSDTGEYIFTIEFNAHDGSLFILDACCGEKSTMPPQSQFEYRVVGGEDGQFLVLDLPIYTP